MLYIYSNELWTILKHLLSIKESLTILHNYDNDWPEVFDHLFLPLETEAFRKSIKHGYLYVTCYNSN